MAWLAWLLGASMAALADDDRSIGPPEAPQTTEGCEIVVEGLPHWAKPHHWVEISGGRMKIDSDPLRVRIAQVDLVARLVGPRYRGEVRLRPSDCTDGVSLALTARPKPATFTFAGPEELAMRCDGGPEGFAGRWWLAHGLGALDVGDGFTATCEFKSPGYAPLRRSVSILPGANEVFVRMSPLAREPSPRP